MWECPEGGEVNLSDLTVREKGGKISFSQKWPYIFKQMKFTKSIKSVLSVKRGRSSSDKIPF